MVAAKGPMRSSMTSQPRKRRMDGRWRTRRWREESVNEREEERGREKRREREKSSPHTRTEGNKGGKKQKRAPAGKREPRQCSSPYRETLPPPPPPPSPPPPPRLAPSLAPTRHPCCRRHLHLRVQVKNGVDNERLDINDQASQLVNICPSCTPRIQNQKRSHLGGRKGWLTEEGQ